MQHAAHGSQEADIMNVLEDKMSHRSVDVPRVLEQRGRTLPWKTASYEGDW